MIELDGMHDDTIKLTLNNMLAHGHKDMGDMPILFFTIRLLDNTWIGQCDLRVGDSPQTEIMGHIGYGIDAPYQGHHYAVRACRLLLDYARRAHMRQLYITCDVDNLASIRTCELLGAEKVGMILVPKDCLDYQRGSRKKYKYRVQL